MPIDFAYEERTSQVRYEVLRRWDMASHEVAHVQCRFVEEDGSLRTLDRLLVCECEFDYDEQMKNGKVVARIMRSDSRQCGARQAVVESVRREVQEKYGAAWDAMSVEDAVMDVFTRHQAGEYLGSFGPMLYIQDVIAILGRTPDPVPDGNGGMIVPIIDRGPGSVFDACFRLRDAERLDLAGWILVPFATYLRLPQELRHFIAYMIEEPLGWPNGEAGDGFVGRLCGVVQDALGIDDGKVLFGARNFPHVAADIMLMTGLAWLAHGINAERVHEPAAHPRVFQNEAELLLSLEGRLRALPRVDESAARAGEWREVRPMPPKGPFSFPAEIRALLLAFFTDTGRSDGEASDLLISIEHALLDSGEFGSAADTFWPHNHPHVEARLLRMFGARWIELALGRAESDPIDREDVLRWPVDLIAMSLKDLIGHLPQASSVDE